MVVPDLTNFYPGSAWPCAWACQTIKFLLYTYESGCMTMQQGVQPIYLIETRKILGFKDTSCNLNHLVPTQIYTYNFLCSSSFSNSILLELLSSLPIKQNIGKTQNSKLKTCEYKNKETKKKNLVKLPKSTLLGL